MALLGASLIIGSPACAPKGGSDGGGCKGKIAYVQNLTGNPKNSEIYVMDCRGKNQFFITLNDFQDYSPSFSPDGSRIAWARSDPNDPNSAYRGIWTANSDGTNQFQLTFEDDANPSWSPDGNEIAFDRFVTDYNLFVKLITGGTPTPLTFAPQRERNPVYSPDGVRIAFERGDDIWDMLRTGGGERQLTNTSAVEESPDYSPDGLQIAYHKWDTNGNTNIWVMDNDGKGSNQTALTFYAGFPSTFNEFPSWSPDGERISFGSNRDLSVGLEVYSMRSKGGGVIRLTNVVGGLASAPDWAQ